MASSNLRIKDTNHTPHFYHFCQFYQILDKKSGMMKARQPAPAFCIQPYSRPWSLVTACRRGIHTSNQAASICRATTRGERSILRPIPASFQKNNKIPSLYRCVRFNRRISQSQTPQPEINHDFSAERNSNQRITRRASSRKRPPWTRAPFQRQTEDPRTRMYCSNQAIGRRTGPTIHFPPRL